MRFKEETMKTRLVNYALVVMLVLITASLCFGYEPDGAAGQKFSQLDLNVQPDKKSYFLGELVGLKFRVVNKSDAPVVLRGGADVWHGLLKVLIAYNDEQYREYLGPGWGLKDVAGMAETEITVGGVFETEATVLYNHRLETGHLSELYTKQAVQNRVDTEYALIRPGIYRIKAVLYDSQFENKIESEPIQISVSEPRGDDLEVWNVIKADPEYGYFIQTGSPKSHPEAAKSKQLVQVLEKVVNSHPQSRYAETIRPSLSKYNSTLEVLRKKNLIRN
jgi:hypothetical protein